MVISSVLKLSFDKSEIQLFKIHFEMVGDFRKKLLNDLKFPQNIIILKQFNSNNDINSLWFWI